MLDEAQVKATFFFSVGPDNMGRHLWRLIRPQFLWKMLRSNAAGLYGWDILLAGTAWPGKPIGRDLGHLMRQARDAGHEVGLHAWDHHGWQANAGRWSDAQLIEQIRRGVDTLSDILGQRSNVRPPPVGARMSAVEPSSASAFATTAIAAAESVPPTWPMAPGAPQIPVDLPTFDEVVGPNVAAKDFNSFILDRFTEKLNVYTIHAEVEGILMANDFRQLLSEAGSAAFTFNPWATCCPRPDTLPQRVVRGALKAAKAGWECKGMSKRWAFPLLLAFGAVLPAASGHPRPVDSR
jgi:undecaprenyl phosphate-alpha-L-ara4FN deformylase